jgi:hypothetical protein
MKPIFLLLTLVLAADAVEPASSALGRCRAVAEAALRLACYDALPLPPAIPAAPVSAAPPLAAVKAAAPVAAVATVASPEAGFGLEGRRSAVQDISTTLPGLFEGWERNTRFTLANGQVWQVSDGSSATYYLRNPKVTVRRAAMGTFMLEIEGANQAPRVQRVE